jgi:hypothetical protein
MLKRSSKTFVISTDTPTSKNFRVRVSGIDLSEYPSNPLLLWMHQRPSKDNDFKALPLGNMEDVELRDGKLYGTPAFDTTDTFAVSISNKVENGTLRAVSAGLIPLEWGLDANGELWLEKSKLKETSICDIGSDPSALAVKLYDENEEMITLSDEYFSSVIKQPNPIDMKLIQLSADMLPLIGLAEGATPEQVQEAIKGLVTLSSTQKTTIDTLTTEKTSAEAKVTELETKVGDMVKLANEQKITALVDGAIAAKKITADQKDNIVKLANADFDGTKAFLDGLKSNPSVKTQVEEQKEKAGDEYLKLSWDEMDKAGTLVKLKAEHPEIFFAKFKQKYGSEHPDKK